MAEKRHKTLVMMAFDPSTGKVSINGGAWKYLQLLRKKGDQPEPPDPPGTERQKAKDSPPPRPGDDRPRCLFCEEHQSCTVHIYDGEWLCLGDACVGPLCS